MVSQMCDFSTPRLFSDRTSKKPKASFQSLPKRCLDKFSHDNFENGPGQITKYSKLGSI